jgi:hypothetical protein
MDAQSPFLTPGSVQTQGGSTPHRQGQRPTEIIYFKFYKSQVPVIEQAIETAALMLGTDKSRGYCLEMICADFLAGANLDSGQPDVLLSSMARFFQFLPGEQRQAFVEQITEKAS